MVLIEEISANASDNVKARPNLMKIAHDGMIGRGRMQELYDMFYQHGPGNGTMLSLPFDQLVEHGIGHMFKWSRCAEPESVIKLANSGYFSAIALSVGQTEKYQALIRSDLPLIVKVDGHLSIGKEAPYDRHSNLASVERVLETGANAIGFTFYIGGKETKVDAERCAKITELSHKNGKPVFMWAYTRGPLPEKMGTDSLYWCCQGVSVAESLGVDVVKQKFPMPVKGEARKAYLADLSEGGYLQKMMPEVSEILKLEPEEEDIETMPSELHVKRLNLLSRVAPNTLKIISGGPKSKNEQTLFDTLEIVMDSGNEGQIVGRNLWGRPPEDSLVLAKKMYDLMRSDVYARKLDL